MDFTARRAFREVRRKTVENGKQVQNEVDFGEPDVGNKMEGLAQQEERALKFT